MTVGISREVKSFTTCLRPVRVTFPAMHTSLKEKYNLLKSQPVDMFPQTQHVENVALLEKI